MNLLEIDWERVYGVFDGMMSQCPGVSCPNACCSVDKALVSYEDGCRVSYNTTLIKPSELEYQFSISPSLDDLGVEVVRMSVEEKIHSGCRGIFPAIALRKCVGDRVCKLAKDGRGRNRKPVLCSAFPFRLSDSRAPLYDISICPRVLEIARDQEIVDRILVVRSMIGIDDYKEWLENLRWLTR